MSSISATAVNLDKKKLKENTINLQFNSFNYKAFDTPWGGGGRHRVA